MGKNYPINSYIGDSPIPMIISKKSEGKWEKCEVHKKKNRSIKDKLTSINNQIYVKVNGIKRIKSSINKIINSGEYDKGDKYIHELSISSLLPTERDKELVEKHLKLKDTIKSKIVKYRELRNELNDLYNKIDELKDEINEGRTIDLFECIHLDNLLKMEPGIFKNKGLQELKKSCNDLTDIYINTFYSIPEELITPKEEHSIKSKVLSIPNNKINKYAKDILLSILSDQGLMEEIDGDDMEYNENIGSPGYIRFQLLANHYRWAKKDQNISLDRLKSGRYYNGSSPIIKGIHGDGKTDLLYTIELFREMIQGGHGIKTNRTHSKYKKKDIEISSREVEVMIRYFILCLIGLDDLKNYKNILIQTIESEENRCTKSIYEDIYQGVLDMEKNYKLQ